MTQNGQIAGVPDAAAILSSIGEAAYAWDIGSDALAWTANAEALFGVTADAIATGRSYAAHVEAAPGQSRAELVAEPGQIDRGDGIPYQFQYGFKRGDGLAWVEDTGRWFAGPDGRPVRAHGAVRRIDERHARDLELARLAKFDALTGELNRSALTNVLASTLEHAVRAHGSCGFLIVSIDRLGRVNESYGIETADEVIAQVAGRLRARMRGKDHLGRFSGNKFGVVLTSCTPDELPIAAERLIADMRDEPVATSAGPIAVTITIGGVTAPRHARSVPEIFARAVDAMHVARARRHGSFAAYQPSLERDARRRETMRATDEIVTALNERRIALAYEPVVHAQTRAVVLHECLMRIQRSDGEIAQAGEIVPVAERLGLVRMLDHRMLELVLAELAADPSLQASMNVSPVSALGKEWSAGLAALLRGAPQIAERLTIEITETAAIQDVDDACGFVTRVKDLGCRVAIDDFGAGYASFRNLRRLGVDMVKVDGAFVQNIVKSEEDRAFVRTLIELARRLSLTTVAEWVQDEEAARLLSGWGCDYLQGALVGLAAPERHPAGSAAA